jgi:hypothetical protein
MNSIINERYRKKMEIHREIIGKIQQQTSANK